MYPFVMFPTCDILVTFPRKEARLVSLRGEVGAEVVLLEGRGGTDVMSAPSLDTELGRGELRLVGEVKPSTPPLK